VRPIGLLSYAACGVCLAGCAVGPYYHSPKTATPSQFVAALNLTAPAQSTPQWWQSLEDSELESLIERAIRANPDIEVALTRLQEARTQQFVLVGVALPAAAASAAAGHGTGSDLSRGSVAPPLGAADNKGTTQIQQVAGFAASWELDLFGGHRRAIEAGRYDVEAASWIRNDVLIGVVAAVAHNYVDMRGLQSRLAILGNNIDSARQSRDLEQARFERGLTNELDFQLASRELATLQSDLPSLKSQIQSTQYTIAVLLGQYPEDLAEELSRPGVLPNLPDTVEPGLPLQLIERRPDVRTAERQLAAATARIGVATANLFPRVLLTGALGTQSGAIGAHGAHLWDFVPGAYWPVLDFGALDALVDIADLQAHEQLVVYKKTVIDAVQDADTAIATFEAQQQRLKDLADAITASERALVIAQQRYDRGLTDFLNVVDAEQQLYSLEDQYTVAEQSAADAYIHLNEALGGGWEPYQHMPGVRHPEPAVIAAFHRLLVRDDPQK
jgi:NodT family efflux transporter outer membrane factor (OMF) lipoprotein